MRPLNPLPACPRSAASLVLSLCLSSLSSPAWALTTSWTNADGGNWSVPGNWDLGVPGPADNAVISLGGTYTVTLDVDATVASLTLGGGGDTQTLSANSRTLTLNGPSSIAASGAMDLVASTINGTGALTNSGTLRLVPGTIDVSLDNQGSLSALNGVCAINGALTTGIGSSLVIDAGKSASAMLTVASGFTNQGTIDLTNNGGNTTLTASLTVTSGTLVNAAGRSINSLAGFNGGPARILTAQLDNQGTLSVGHPLTMDGTSADHANSGVIQATGGNLTITQSGTTPSFTNSGAVTIGSERTVALNGGAFIYNGGVFSGWPGIMQIRSATVTLNTDLIWSVYMQLLLSTIGGSGRLVNAAQARITGSTLNVPYEVQAGNHTIFGGSASTTNLNGAITMGSGCTFSVAGEIGGPSVTNFANGFTNNGTIQLRNFFPGQSATLNIASGTLVNPPGRIIEVHVGSGGGTRNLNAQIDNQGTIRTVSADLIINQPSSDHLSSGVIQATGGDVTITQSGTTPSFTNSGAVTIASGRTVALSGGAFIYDGGSFSGWPGIMRISSANVTVNTDLLWSVNMELLDSTIGGTGRLINGAQARISGSTVQVPYEAQTGNHTIFGRGATNLNGAITMGAGCSFSVGGEFSGPAVLTVANGFTNNGTIQLRNFFFGQSTTLNVTNGTLVNAPGRVIEALLGSGGSGMRNLNAQIDNQGTLRTVDTSLIIAKPSSDHLSSGAIEVSGGNLTITQSGTTPTFVNSGSITIASTRTLASTAGTLTNLATGEISGSGTLDVASSFTNHGRITPGVSTAILSVIGDAPFSATGALGLEIAGPTVGTGYDRLAVSGTATLDGTLEVFIPPGFCPGPGDNFRVVTAGTRAGTFDAINVTGQGNPVFDAQYDATGLTLVTTSNVVTLTTGVIGGGSLTVKPDQPNYDCGSPVQITAVPGAGWPFDHWEGDASGNDNPLAVIMDGDKSITAVFLDVVPPVVALTSPNGGEVWEVGSTQPITWTATDNAGVSGVDLHYSVDGGATYPFVIATGAPNSGALDWVIPDPPTLTARVRVTARDGAQNAANDGSDNDFEIRSPIVAVADVLLGDEEIMGVYPNPAASGQAHVLYRLPGAARVEVSIYDSSGRLVRKLERGTFAGGIRSLTWDGRDAGERPVSAGVYFVRLVAGSRMRAMKPIVLLR